MSKLMLPKFDRWSFIVMVLVGWIVLMVCLVSPAASKAQGTDWALPKTIPGYDLGAGPPILVADQVGRVHAFSSQWINREVAISVKAVVYNQWTLQNGWTEPVDIIMSPIKEARVTDAYLDDNEIMHIVFWGGDGTGANIYYSYSPLSNVNSARSWSEPTLIATNAGDPEGAVFVENSLGHFVVVYNGREYGNGIYAIISLDGGNSWSGPSIVFTTTTEEPNISQLRVIQSNSGWLLAVWNVYTEAGQGRRIYYARSRDGIDWSDPVPLAVSAEGLGVRDMTVIEYRDTILITYIMPPKFIMRSSIDDGVNWKDPSIIFPRHVGANGPASLVIDGNDSLHMFFGQRISGSPDIHGMWHSTWTNNRWMEPEAVIKGPQNVDRVGDRSFDPNDARAVVSQGNVMLVTWRTDPGLKGNGVWYSYKVLDMTKLSPHALYLPTLHIQQESTSTPALTDNMKFPENTPTQIPVSDSLSIEQYSPSTGWPNGSSIVFGIMPAIGLLLILVIIRITRNKLS